MIKDYHKFKLESKVWRMGSRDLKWRKRNIKEKILIWKKMEIKSLKWRKNKLRKQE